MATTCRLPGRWYDVAESLFRRDRKVTVDQQTQEKDRTIEVRSLGIGKWPGIRLAEISGQRLLVR
jgi:hypothetical protein